MLTTIRQAEQSHRGRGLAKTAPTPETSKGARGPSCTHRKNVTCEPVALQGCWAPLASIPLTIERALGYARSVGVFHPETFFEFEETWGTKCLTSPRAPPLLERPQDKTHAKAAESLR